MAKRKKSVGLGRFTSRGFVGAAVEESLADYVIAELRYEAPVTYTAEKFASRADGGKEAETLNSVLARYRVAELRPHFPVKRAAIRERAMMAAQLPTGASTKAIAGKGAEVAEFVQSGFVQVVPRKGESATRLAAALSKASWGWAYLVGNRAISKGKQRGRFRII